MITGRIYCLPGHPQRLWLLFSACDYPDFTTLCALRCLPGFIPMVTPSVVLQRLPSDHLSFAESQDFFCMYLRVTARHNYIADCSFGSRDST
ncbi:hypothetical protein LEMLEM_LOCUS25123, partial [Lemmus lemmus]